MVQTDQTQSGEESPTPIISTDPPATTAEDEPQEPPQEPPVNTARGIPLGNYRLVGWGADTTGRRLIDELCQIAAHTPDAQFAQYIMPFNDVNPLFSRRHNIRIVNTRYYRRLKDLKTNQYVKTKSEMSALQDFVQWLETTKAEADGVVLVYHEMRKAAPGMLLESLRRYGLVERFGKCVVGFVNGFDVARVTCFNTTKSFSLRVLGKVLLNRDEACVYSSAVDRARASYEIALHLAQEERQELLDAKASGDCGGGGAAVEPAHVMRFVCPFANPIEAEEEEVAGFKVLLERQNTFKPVFGALLKASRTERQKASYLRRLLAVNNLDYEKLHQAFETSAKEGLEKLIKNEIANAKETDLEELLEILDCFFDPEKEPVAPKPRPGFNNNNNTNNNNNNNHISHHHHHHNHHQTRPYHKRYHNNNKKTSTSESHSPNMSSDNADSGDNTPRDVKLEPEIAAAPVVVAAPAELVEAV